jgi:hypothetical protein
MQRQETSQEQVKAFLDAYARLCEDHGLSFTGWHGHMWLEAFSGDGVSVEWKDDKGMLLVIETATPKKYPYDVREIVSSVKVGGQG